MIIKHFSGFSKDKADEFIDLINTEFNKLPQLTNKFYACPYEIYIIAGELEETYFTNHPSIDNQIIRDLHYIWERQLTQDHQIPEKILNNSTSFERFGKSLFSSKDAYPSRLFRFHVRPDCFFLFLDREFYQHIPFFELTHLAYLWKIEEGFLPLHASGVIHHNGIYLFSAPSGFGKSTIAYLSQTQGDQVLDDDQLMLLPTGNGQYTAEGWGYALQKTNAKVRGFFRLEQSKNNSLSKLAPLEITRYFWEESIIARMDRFDPDIYRDLFHRIAEFSRVIPGYKLKFKKSLDFWKLIDTEIPA